ncbi:MAG: Gfo/Idh/MocA family oxidoreductase [Betaproteobacteria bacterium]|nr:Gfo/Idh/MocA family oxidoreductase [Betaproteobacteria bacterium]
MKKIRWGILGAARVNERLLPAIANSPFGDLFAIGSRRANAANECLEKYQPNLKDKVETFNSLDEVIFHPDIDAIYIPLSNEEHTEPALKAINHKKHVLIEKPIALHSKEVKALQKAAEKNHVKVMEGFMYVFHPQFDRVKEIISSGLLGDVQYVHSMFSFPIQPARFYRINRSIENGGGALWDIGPYAIHTIRQCFEQNPLSIVAKSHLNEHRADLTTSGIIDFGNNRRAQFDISFECIRRSQFEIFGSKGKLMCHTLWQHENDEALLTLTTDTDGAKNEHIKKANHFTLEIDHFNQCIINNTAPKLSLNDALWNTKTLEAIQSSIKTKTWVHLTNL